MLRGACVLFEFGSRFEIKKIRFRSVQIKRYEEVWTKVENRSVRNISGTLVVMHPYIRKYQKVHLPIKEIPLPRELL